MIVTSKLFHDQVQHLHVEHCIPAWHIRDIVIIIVEKHMIVQNWIFIILDTRIFPPIIFDLEPP